MASSPARFLLLLGGTLQAMACAHTETPLPIIPPFSQPEPAPPPTPQAEPLATTAPTEPEPPAGPKTRLKVRYKADANTECSKYPDIKDVYEADSRFQKD